MLENLPDSVNNAGFDIAHIGDVQELSFALATLGIDVSGLGDLQIDLLLDALHHNGMTVADLADTAPVASRVDTSAGVHQNVPVSSTGSPDVFVAATAMGTAAGLKDIAQKAVNDAYDRLITLLKGRYQKHHNVVKK